MEKISGVMLVMGIEDISLEKYDPIILFCHSHSAPQLKFLVLRILPFFLGYM